MTLPLPDPLVVRNADQPELGEDAGQRVSPWGVQRNLERIASQFPVSGDQVLYPMGTVLPAAGTEGQVVAFDAGVDGVVWTFRYDAATGSNPWQFVGGGPLYNQSTSASALGHATGTYNDRLSITVPLSGDYMVEARVGELNTTAGNDTVMCLVNAAGRNLDRRLCRNSNASPQSSGGGPAYFSGVTAGQTLAISAYHVALGGGSTVGFLGLTVIPIRVSG